MFTKTTLALTVLLAAASGALAATKQPPHNDVYDPGAYNAYPLEAGRDCVRVAFPQCGGN